MQQSTMSKKKKISVKENYSVMLLWTNNADFFMRWHKVNKYCLVVFEDFSLLHEAARHTRRNIYFKRLVDTFFHHLFANHFKRATSALCMRSYLLL